MQALVKSDVFFFVTTVAVVVVTVVLVLVLVRLFRVLGDVKKISRAANQEAASIKNDLDAAREHVKQNGFASIIGFFTKGAKKRAHRKREE